MNLEEYISELVRVPDKLRIAEGRTDAPRDEQWFMLIQERLERLRDLSLPSLALRPHLELLDYYTRYVEFLREKAPASPTTEELVSWGLAGNRIWRDRQALAEREGIEMPRRRRSASVTVRYQ